ncbi:MAG: hypothetical protein GX592_08900, partial [Clostridiales bacterium]|nr:hypothetical protein [Clostridiales bacterium]
TFDGNTAPEGGGVYASSPVTLDTEGDFIDSVLCFKAAPTIERAVGIQLSAGNPLGMCPVLADDITWLPDDGFAWTGAEGYGLMKVVNGTGGAMQVWGATEVEVTVSDVAYGSAPAPTATVSQGEDEIAGATVTFTYAIEGSGTYTSAVPTAPGDYSVKGSYPGDDAAFLMASEGTADFSINPATPTVTLSNKTATYNRKPIEIGEATVTGGGSPPGGLTYTYYADEDCETELDGPPTNAGIYYVKATVAATGNYGTATSGKATLTINKATPTATLLDKYAIYTGDPIIIDTLELEGVNDGVDTEVPPGEPIYAYYLTWVDWLTHNALLEAPVYAGEYIMQVTLPASANYEEGTSDAKELTIGRATPTVTLKDKSAEYTGNPIEIGAATVTGVKGEALAAQVTYEYHLAGSLTPLAGPPTDVGAYDVRATAEAQGNYADATSEPAKLTIVEADEEEDKEDEEDEEDEEQTTETVEINGVAVELVVGPTEDLTVNGETLEGALVDGSGTPRRFTAHLEKVEAMDGEPAQVILFITAEPDLDADGKPVLDADGNPLFSQRNLELEPEWIRKLAALGITDICYVLGDASLMLPLSAFEGEGLEAATGFSIRVAPIYEGETRPAEEAALSGYAVESGLYRVYIVMETAEGEVDVAALLAGAALRLPAEEDVAPEELERYGMLYVMHEGAATVLAASHGPGPSQDGVERAYWTSAIQGRGLYALVTTE